jgi:general secretion pathway protein D
MLAQNQSVRSLLIIALAGQLLTTAFAAVAAGADKPRARPAATRGAAQVVAGGCKPLPSSTKIKVSLKPETEVADLITWYATLTCTPVLVSNRVPLAGKKVTLLTPTPVIVADLHRLFIAALESVGLTVDPDGKFLIVIESARARHSNTPVTPAR